jgi:hypothetical protein
MRMRRAHLIVAALLAAGCVPESARRQPSAYAETRPGPTPSADPTPAPLPPDRAYVCTAVATLATRGSFCYPTQEACDVERASAAQAGAQAGECAPGAPVACFQLGGDPSPKNETCAATLADCELLRTIDRDRGGTTGAPCAWRHGPPETR